MKVMGIDGSSKKTGIAVYDGNLREYKCLDFSKIKNYDERYPSMVYAVEDCITKFKPDVVYVEDTWEKNQGFNNVATLKKLSYILGTFRFICLEKNIPFNLIFPTEWRKAIGMETGKLKRPELKQLAIKYVKDKYGIEVCDDVAEAICIAEAGFKINHSLFERYNGEKGEKIL